MTVSFVQKLAAVVIPVGSDMSNIIDATNMHGDAALIGIILQDEPSAGTYFLLVSHNGTDFFALADATNTPMTLPTIGLGRVYVELCAFPYWRIQSSADISGTPVTFQATKHWTT